MPQRHDERHDRAEPEPEIYWIHVEPRKHTAETITLLVTLLLLFALLTLLVGHPAPPPRSRFVIPAHPSEKR